MCRRGQIDFRVTRFVVIQRILVYDILVNVVVGNRRFEVLVANRRASGGFTAGIGFDVDNHAINTVPKETLIRITKAEDGGLGGEGLWKPEATKRRPGTEDHKMRAYLAGEMTTVRS